jgi:hypothetical protein
LGRAKTSADYGLSECVLGSGGSCRTKNCAADLSSRAGCAKATSQATEQRAFYSASTKRAKASAETSTRKRGTNAKCGSDCGASKWYGEGRKRRDFLEELAKLAEKELRHAGFWVDCGLAIFGNHVGELFVVDVNKASVAITASVPDS